MCISNVQINVSFNLANKTFVDGCVKVTVSFVHVSPSVTRDHVGSRTKAIQLSGASAVDHDVPGSSLGQGNDVQL